MAFFMSLLLLFMSLLSLTSGRYAERISNDESVRYVNRMLKIINTYSYSNPREMMVNWNTKNLRL